MIKTINLILEDIGIQVESNDSSDLITVKLNSYVINEEKSVPGHTHYEVKDVIEVYPTIDEVKEIIKALQQVLPKEELE